MLTTLSSVKSYAGITDTTQDAVLTQLIAQVSAWIEGQLGGRVIEEATYEEELYDVHMGTNEVLLKQWPITDTEPFVAEQRSGSLEAPTWTPFTANDYILVKGPGIVSFQFKFSNDVRQAIRFTYSAGYATVPADLELLANKLVVSQLNAGESTGIKSESLEGHSITYQDSSVASDPDMSAILQKYQRKLVGYAF